MESWFLITTKTGEQDRAEDNLFSQCYEVFNPKIRVDQGNNGVRQIPLFSGYMFVKYDPMIKSSAVINNTRGVLKLVTFGSDPVRVADKIIEEIQKQLGLETTKQLLTGEVIYEKDDKVEITFGPMAGMKAIFLEKDNSKRSMLLIEFLGSQKTLSVDNKHFA